MTFTPEKVAEALDELRGYMRCAEIAEHSAAAYRDSNGKTWLLEFKHLRTVLDALAAVTAERDAALGVIREALGFTSHTLYANEDNGAGVKWSNGEVLELLGDMQAILSRIPEHPTNTEGQADAS